MCINRHKVVTLAQGVLLLAVVIVTTSWAATMASAQTLGGGAPPAGNAQWNARQQDAGYAARTLYPSTDQRYAAPAGQPAQVAPVQQGGLQQPSSQAPVRAPQQQTYVPQVQGGPLAGAHVPVANRVPQAYQQPQQQYQQPQQQQLGAGQSPRVATRYGADPRWEVAQRNLEAPTNFDTAPTTEANWQKSSEVVQQLNSNVEKMEMTVSTSRILTIDGKFSRAQVNNPEVLSVTPLAPNELQVSALKPGVTQIHLWDDTKRVYSVDVAVYGDVQELQMALKDQYPYSAIRVYRYSNSLVLSGYVDRPDYVSSIVRLSEDYAPKIINNMKVGGVQQILLNVQVMEVSRTKLRAMGFDFANVNGDNFIVSSISGLISAAGSQTGTAVGSGETIRFGIVDGSNSFFGFLRLLRENRLAKILAEPKLVTVSGRPATFNVGGEIPVPVPQSLGSVTIEYKKYGTQVDFLPIVLGNGNIRLEVRPRISELDYTNSIVVNGSSIPGLKERMIDTGVEMKAGQTLALAGLIQNRIESTNRGIPVLADMPWLGAAFRSVNHQNNEIELLIMVRPELVQAMDPHEVPPGGPGLNTVDPCDTDLYWRGHVEVPRCSGCNNGNCQDCNERHSSQEYSGTAAPGQYGPGSSGEVPQTPGHPDPYAARPSNGRVGATAPTGRMQNPNNRQTQASASQPVYVQPNNTAGAAVAQGAPQQRIDSASSQNHQSAPRNRYEPVRPAPQGNSVNTPGMIGPLGYDVVK